MGSDATGSEERTVRSFQASAFNFADCLRRRASRLRAAALGLLAVLMLVLLPAAMVAQTAHFSGAQVMLAPNAFSMADGIAIDSSGNLFVTDILSLTVYEMPLVSGSYGAPVALSFGGTAFRMPTDVAVDAGGNLYVTDCGASPAVYKITYSPGYASGTVTQLGAGSSFVCPNSVAVDAAGDVFVADEGGSGGSSWAYEIASGSTTAAPLGGSAFTEAYGIAVDSQGQNVFVSDVGYGHVGVYEISLSNRTSVTQAGTGNLALFRYPSRFAFAENGDLLVVDSQSSSVLRLSAASGYASVSVAYTMPPPQPGPVGLAIDAKGNFYMTGSSAVYQVMLSGVSAGTVNVNDVSSPETAMVFTFDTGGQIGAPTVVTQGASSNDFTDGGDGACTYYGTSHAYNPGDTCSVNVRFVPSNPGQRLGAAELFDNAGNLLATGYLSGVGVSPQVIFSPVMLATYVGNDQVSQPQGIAVDAAGNLYYTDFTNRLVQLQPRNGNLSPVTLMSSASGLGTPESVAVDGAGNVYVADSGNGALGSIWRVPYSSAAGTFGTPVAIDSGLNLPGGVAVDGAGNVYIAETGNDAVWELPFRLGGTYGNPQQLNCSFFDQPYSVTVDDSGNIYTALFGANAIVILPPGGCTNASQETVITNPAMNGPTSVAVNHAGDIFVANYNNGNVLKFAASDRTHPQALYGDTLTNPFGLAFDGWDNLFISDAGSATIYQAQSWSPWVSFTTQTAPGTTDTTDGPQAAIIANFGNAPLTVSSIGMSGAPDFQLVGGTCETTGFSLSPGQSCDLSIEFEPQSAGMLSEHLSVADNNQNEAAGQWIAVWGDSEVAETLTSLNVTGFPSPGYSGALGTVTITALDQNGQPFTTYNGTATITTSDPNAVINGGWGNTVEFQNGVATEDVTFFTPGQQSITATSGSVTGQQTGIQINLVTLSVTGYPSPQSVNASGEVAVSALDENGVKVGSFSGTATLSTSDPNAIISAPNEAHKNLVGVGLVKSGSGAPPDSIFLEGGRGLATVTFGTVGTQSITASGTGMTSGSQIGIVISSALNFVVNTAADDATGTASNCPSNPATGGPGSCTLRDAIDAVAAVGAGNITFDPTVFAAANTAAQNTILLSNGSLEIPSNVSITGPTANSNGIATNLVSIDGGWDGTVGDSAGTTVLVVDRAVTVATINNLNIQHGNNQTGGGINNQGTLTVSNDVFSGNLAGGGAGVNGGTGADGGAILNSGALTVVGSTFANNSANGSTHGEGGAIYSNGSSTVISGSTFSGNSAIGQGKNAGGGAICNYGSLVSIVNSTFFGNSASGQTGTRGGAIVNHASGKLSVVNSTLTGNWANQAGGGIFVENGTATMANSILDGNWLGTASTTTIYDDLDDQSDNSTLTGGASDGGGNMVGHYNGNQATVTPVGLAPLGNYGGPTQTMIPLPGSPAICAGLMGSIASGVRTDQRGIGYPNVNTAYSGYTADSPCVDAGAVETNYAVSFSTEPSDVAPNTNFTAGVTLTESGSLFQPPVTIPLKMMGTGTLTGWSATTASGVASYTLQVSAAGSDTLTALLTLNPGVTPLPAVVATSNSFSVGETTITMSPAGGTLSAGTVGAIYTQTFTPSGGTSPYTFSSSGSLPAGLTLSTDRGVLSGTPTAAGGPSSFSVTAADSNRNHLSQAYTLSIGKGTATVTLSNLLQTYSGSALSATATTTPANLAVTFSYNGSSTPPTAAGSYSVVGTINDANYNGSATGTMTIAKAAAKVTLSNLSQTYTGSALTATATTNPTSLAVSIAYAQNGASVAAPVAPGTYSVTARVTDNNYTGSATGTLVVSSAASSVSLTSSANPATLSNAVTLTAAVSSTAGTTVGQVTFLDGTSPIGSATISTGVAALTTSTLTAGTHSITATYAGSADLAGSSSSALSLTVVDFSVGSSGGSGGSGGGTGSSQTASPGGSASYTVPLVPSAGTTFPTAMTLTVTGLPTGATAMLGTQGWTQQTPTSWTLPANQPVGNVSLTVQLPTQTAASDRNDVQARKLPFVALGILLLPFARKWRSAGKRMSRWLCLALVAAGMATLTGSIGCGGHSSSGSSSQPQSYTVTVTVNSGTLTHSTQLTLTVD